MRKSVSKNTDNHAILTYQWEPISDQKIAIINMESSCLLIDVKTQQKLAFLLWRHRGVLTRFFSQVYLFLSNKTPQTSKYEIVIRMVLKKRLFSSTGLSWIANYELHLHAYLANNLECRIWIRMKLKKSTREYHTGTAGLHFCYANHWANKCRETCQDK